MIPIAELHAPAGSFFPCLVFLLYPLFFIYLLNRSVMGEIGCAYAIFLAFTSVYLLSVLWAVKEPYYHYLALTGIITIILGPPIISAAYGKVNDKLVEAEQFAICYDQIRANPNNAIAALRLAKLLYTRGDKGCAVAIAEMALVSLPRSAFFEEHRDLQNWKRHVDITQIQDIQCVSCNRMIPPNALICPNCLGSVHLDRARKMSVRYGGGVQQGFIVWGVLLIILFAIPFLGQLSPAITIPSIIVLLGVAGWAVVKAFGLGFSK